MFLPGPFESIFSLGVSVCTCSMHKNSRTGKHAKAFFAPTDRKWADFELEDDGDLGDLAPTPGGFETRPDSDGIKTVTNYLQNAKGETLKVI